MREARKGEVFRGRPPSDPEVLDDVSDHLGEVLRRADALLVEWTKFGAQVQIQVDREARAIGDTVASSVEDAVTRATLSSIEHALGDQITARMSALAGELARLEQRTRAAATSVQRARSTDRKLLWAVLAGIVGANVLLAVVLVRRPSEIIAPAPEPLRVELPIATPDAGVVLDAPVAVDAGSAGSAAGSAHAAVGSATTLPARVPARPRKK
ncbi:MAG: hypothetical protein WKG01_24235 [Kofleriaceae bacterium]